MFALDADEEDLTHHGKSIRDMERFDDIDITDDEMEESTYCFQPYSGSFVRERSNVSGASLNHHCLGDMGVMPLHFLTFMRADIDMNLDLGNV